MPYRPVATIWKNNISNLIQSFELWWESMESAIPDNGCDVFFRADDIGYPGLQFSDMISIFKKHSVPLALAVVPAWINEKRVNDLLRELGPNLDLWCLHQHGYRHVNHKTEKKI